MTMMSVNVYEIWWREYEVTRTFSGHRAVLRLRLRPDPTPTLRSNDCSSGMKLIIPKPEMFQEHWDVLYTLRVEEESQVVCSLEKVKCVIVPDLFRD